MLVGKEMHLSLMNYTNYVKMVLFHQFNKYIAVQEDFQQIQN